jgi:flavorubredoxin
MRFWVLHPPLQRSATVQQCLDRGQDYHVAGHRDGDTMELGERKLRFIETPHVHHWDSMMVFEETTGSLFPADLYIQWGDQPPIVRENLGKGMCQGYRESGNFAASEPVLRVVDRIEKLDPQWIHPMHGGACPKRWCLALLVRFGRRSSPSKGRYSGG